MHVDGERSPVANRHYKDTVFRDLFGSPVRKENPLELYNALAGTDYADPNELELNTLDDVIYFNYKNDVSFMVGDELVLVENQSTPNSNMPLRGLVYFGRLYAAVAERLGERLYGKTLVHVPPARFVVVYCGPVGAHPAGELRLSDAFEGRESDVEVRCQVVDLNDDAATHVLDASPVFAAYAELVRRTEGYREIIGLDGAVKRVIDEMVEEGGVLSEYLVAKRAEVTDMFMTEFDEERLRGFDRSEGFEQGVRQGVDMVVAKLREMGVDESALDAAARDALAEHEECASIC